MKKIIAAILVLFLIAPMPILAAVTYETNIEKGVNFRSAPSVSAYIYRMLSRGEDVHVISKVNSYWLKIQVRDGTIGYISAKPEYTDYKASTTLSKADRIINLSKSLIGKVSYAYGVRNPSKFIFDCSSFTEYVFEKNGVSLPWGTRYQKKVGSYVSKSNLRKGDLVFFSTSGSTIDHVGIYIGSGQFIHNTPSKGGLSISYLTSGYWRDNYETARRVL